MKNPMPKIKKIVKNNGDAILVGAIAGTACLAGMATYKWLIQRGSIVVPQAIVDHMKDCDGSVLGVGMIKDYDVLVKLIPVQQ